MSQADDLRAYRMRWEAVNVVQRREQAAASLALRWQQLNTAVLLARSLGWLRPDPDEAGVFERWAKLKEKAASLKPKV